MGVDRESVVKRVALVAVEALLCVKYACKHIEIKAPMSVDGYLLRVRYGTGTAPTLVKMSPRVYAAMEAASHIAYNGDMSANPMNKMDRL